MELQGEDGAIIFLEAGCKKQLGRGPGIASTNPTVSRRQVLLELPKGNDENKGSDEEDFAKLYVQVLGPNPVCINRSGESKEKPTLEFLKKGENGYLGLGDRLSLSVKQPHFFTLKKGCSEKTANEEEAGIEEAVARRQRRTMERKQRERLQTENALRSRDNEEAEQQQHQELNLDLEKDEAQIQDVGLDSLDLLQIDPVAEFGFLVEGSEFKQYGKRCEHDIGKWDWCLSKDSEKSSEDEDVMEQQEAKGRKGKGGKKKETKHEKKDEDWTGESEEEMLQITKLKGAKKPNYMKTRSKIPRTTATSKVSASARSKEKQSDDDVHDDDETLGGFIVDDEAETTDSEEEEEELTDDDFEEDDEDEDEIEDKVQVRKSRKERKPLCKYGINCYRKNKEHLAEFRHAE